MYYRGRKVDPSFWLLIAGAVIIGLAVSFFAYHFYATYYYFEP